jgi:hypothetical protein
MSTSLQKIVSIAVVFFFHLRNSMYGEQSSKIEQESTKLSIHGRGHAYPSIQNFQKILPRRPHHRLRLGRDRHTMYYLWHKKPKKLDQQLSSHPLVGIASTFPTPAKTCLVDLMVFVGKKNRKRVE